MPSLAEIGPAVLMKNLRFLNIVSVFMLSRYNLSLEKGVVLPLDILESPSPKDALCKVWLKQAH